MVSVLLCDLHTRCQRSDHNDDYVFAPKDFEAIGTTSQGYEEVISSKCHHNLFLLSKPPLIDVLSHVELMIRPGYLGIFSTPW
jgi:hypothetical protein